VKKARNPRRFVGFVEVDAYHSPIPTKDFE
jgi:hypothetical protein